MLLLQGWDTEVVGIWIAQNLDGCQKKHTSICSISLQQARGQLWARHYAGEIKMSNKHGPHPQRSHSSVRGWYISWHPEQCIARRRHSKNIKQVRSQGGQAKIGLRSWSLAGSLTLNLEGWAGMHTPPLCRCKRAMHFTLPRLSVLMCSLLG